MASEAPAAGDGRDDDDEVTVPALAERFWRGDVQKDAVSPLHNALTILHEYHPGLAFIMTFANVVVVDTVDGLVLVDCGAFLFKDMIFDRIREYAPTKPVHTCVYTHGHVDHVFGIMAFDEEAEEKGLRRPRVVAHKLLPARFDRYKLTLGYNSVINSRQFQAPFQWPAEYRYPDLTYDDKLVLEVGGVRFELYHDKGETDDATWVYIPKYNTICTGDFFIWAAPNCGNPQKAQRYPMEWSRAMRRMATKNAELLLPGHGPPVVGKDRVRRALTDVADYLDSVIAQTLRGINAGWTRNEVLHSVVPPAHLLARPYLRPVYDDPFFVVANMWRLYAGWYDGKPPHIRPPRDTTLARHVADAAGGVVALVDRATGIADRTEGVMAREREAGVNVSEAGTLTAAIRDQLSTAATLLEFAADAIRPCQNASSAGPAGPAGDDVTEGAHASESCSRASAVPASVATAVFAARKRVFGMLEA